MQYIVGPRGSGRTTKLIQWYAHKLWLGEKPMIIAPNAQAGRYLEDLAIGVGGSHRDIVHAQQNLRGAYKSPMGVDCYEMLSPQDVSRVPWHVVEVCVLEGPVKNF